MSREIEYRAKNNLGNWVYGCVAVVSVWKGFSVWKIFNDKNGVDGTPIDPKTLGQYTGLKDKNGVKIFEGDVIQQHHFYDAQGVEQSLTHIVEWSDKYSGWFALNADSMDESDGSQQLWAYMKSGYETKVIGNIHEDKK